MLTTLPKGGMLVQKASDLPDLRFARDLFMDFETSGDGVEPGNSPRHGHKVAGIAAAADDGQVYYVPVGHTGPRGQFKNLPHDVVSRWVRDAVDTCDQWVNHNVKFDAKFARVEFGAKVDCVLRDTLDLAKLIESDRGYGAPGYALDELALDWLNVDMSEGVGRVKNYLESVKLPRRKKCKDYGVVPIDILGDYGAVDVAVNRDLWREMLRRRDPEVKRVWAFESALISVLLDVECEGMRVDVEALLKAELRLNLQLLQIEEKIHKQCGQAIRPHVNDDCFDLLCNHFGLPVLAWTDDEDEDGQGSPSFDKEALTSYLSHPVVAGDESIRRVVMLLREYRKKHTLLTFFVQKYLSLQVDGIMYPTYNPSVRTGRMSCKSPSTQQLNHEAKEFVIPGRDWAFLSKDYKQIEFRWLMHYGRDPEPLLAFQRDPDTDFHAWVAGMCRIHRKPAKNVNFCIAFGGGKKKVLSMLANNMELVGSLGGEIDGMIERGELPASARSEAFTRMCEGRAKEVFNTYHATLPGIRKMTRHCAEKLEQRGWIRNAFGRRRHLAARASYRAFNSVVQSTAADLMKQQTVCLSPRFNSWARGLDLRLAASVHDETKSRLPIETAQNPEVQGACVAVLESVWDLEMRVPMRASCGYSDKTWADAGDDGETRPVYRGSSQQTDSALKASREAFDHVLARYA